MNNLLFVLCQITTTDEPVAKESVTLLDLAIKGGWFMIPILVLSILGFYVFFERLMALKKATADPEQFIAKIKEMVLAGDIKGAKLLCAQYNTPVSRMIDKGLSRIGHPLKNIEAAIENVAKIEIYLLERNLSVLATVSGAAPMIGFLGTVTGMISAFIAIAQEEGNVSPKLLSAGIYEAMITTAAGLIVGVIAYFFYNYLVTKISKVVHRMEYSAIEFIDLLQDAR